MKLDISKNIKSLLFNTKHKSWEISLWKYVNSATFLMSFFRK